MIGPLSIFRTEIRTLSGFYYWKARCAYACFLDAEDDFPSDAAYRELMLEDAVYYQTIARNLYIEERGLL